VFDGNIYDCAGECGGDATVDDCGICNGTGIDEDADGICDDVDDCVGAYDACDICNGPGEIYECGCSDIPEGDCDCDGNILDECNVCGGSGIDEDADGICDDVDDCVGVFNGDVCVGATKWMTEPYDFNENGIIEPGSEGGCNNGVCSINVYGDDSSEYSDGYMLPGQFPTFKIYDTSENIYYNAASSSEETWSSFCFNVIDSLNGYSSILGCTDSNACNYNENATDEDGSCLYDDCSGECGGNAVVDDCGICNGTGVDNDEDGICDDVDDNYNCDGSCGGINDAIIDCLGVCAGETIVDECGICNGIIDTPT
jgi:hypothetical protein